MTFKGDWRDAWRRLNPRLVKPDEGPARTFVHAFMEGIAGYSPRFARRTG